MGAEGQRYFWEIAWENYYPRFWSLKEVINKICRLRAAGKAINLAAVAGAGEWYPIRAATHFFGSWRAAVEAAGFGYDDIRADVVWTREKVLDGILGRLRRGLPISSREVQLTDPRLFAGAVRPHTFGSWARAVEANGVPYERVHKYRAWDMERIKEEAEALRKSGAPLNAKSVCKNYPSLYCAVCRRYGSWNKGLAAMGYDISRFALRRKRSREEILQKISEMYRNGVHMSDNNVRRLNGALYTAACREFGTCTLARRKAGIRWSGAKNRPLTACLAGFEHPISRHAN